MSLSHEINTVKIRLLKASINDEAVGGSEALAAKLLLMASKTNEIADFVGGYEDLAGHPMPQKIADATRDYLTRTHAFLDDLESIKIAKR